jgi:hypothetical protein
MAAQRSQAGRRRGRKLAWLAVIAGLVRDHWVQNQAAVVIVVLAALAGIGRDTKTRSVAGTAAWLRKLDERAEHVKKESRRAAAAAERAAAATERKAAGAVERQHLGY